jgi:hypothetical protein
MECCCAVEMSLKLENNKMKESLNIEGIGKNKLKCGE